MVRTREEILDAVRSERGNIVDLKGESYNKYIIKGLTTSGTANHLDGRLYWLTYSAALLVAEIERLEREAEG